MGTHQIDRTIEGPFHQDDPLLLALQFYQENLYDPAQPKQLAQDPMTTLDVVRGKPNAGWYASDMSQLHTQVKLTHEEDHILVHYDIDTTGQRLSAEDRQFWDNEIQALQDTLCDGAQIINLAEAEGRRAEEQRESSITTGLKWGLGLAIVIVTIAFLIKTFTNPPTP